MLKNDQTFQGSHMGELGPEIFADSSVVWLRLVIVGMVACATGDAGCGKNDARLAR